MTLRNGAHIGLAVGDIDGDDRVTRYFMLNKVPDAMQHSYEMFVRSPYSAYVIEGSNDTNLNRGVFFWDMNDWSGGEGEGETGGILWTPDDPTVYDNGLLNPRIPGQITAPPTRTDSNIAAALTSTLRPAGHFAWAAGYLWFAYNDGAANPAHLAYYDGATWTDMGVLGDTDGDDVPDSTDFFLCAIVGKGDFVYVSLVESFTQDPGPLQVRRIDAAGDNVLIAEGANAHVTKGMAELQAFIYGWTAQNLGQFDTTLEPPIDGVPVYGAGRDVDPVTTTGDMCRTNNSVVMLESAESSTQLHEYVLGGPGSPIWHGPKGFTGNCITHLGGTVFIAGNYSGTNSAALWAVNVEQKVDWFVGHIRQNSDDTLTPSCIGQGIGAQILIGMEEGLVFIYDLERDAFSLLDDVTSVGDRVCAVGTYGANRVAAIRNQADLRFRLCSWATDIDVPVNGTFTLDSGEWDAGLPMEQDKILEGVHVRTKSACSNHRTVTVNYSVDGGAFTSAGTMDAGHDRYLKISTPANTVLGGTFRFQIEGTSTHSAAAPVVTRVTPRIENWNYRENWKMDLLLNPEDRVSDDDPDPEEVRGWLRDLMADRVLIDLYDGTIQSVTADPLDEGEDEITATVIIKDMTDAADGNGIGHVLLTLASVAVR